MSATPVQTTTGISKVSSRTLQTVEVHSKHSEDSQKKTCKLAEIPVLQIASDNFEDIWRTKGTAVCLSKLSMYGNFCEISFIEDRNVFEHRE